MPGVAAVKKTHRARRDHVARDLRAHEEITPVDRVVQTVNREHVYPVHEPADERREIHGFREQCLRGQPVAARQRVVIQRARRHVAPRDFGAVQVGDKAVVVIDRHRQRGHRRRARDVESVAQKRRRFSRHRREQIRADQRQVAAPARPHGHRTNHQSARVADEFEVHGIPCVERARARKHLAFRAAAALENDHANRVIPRRGKRELPDEIVRPGEHVVALRLARIEEVAVLVQIDLDAVAVVAVHPKRPHARRRNRDRARAFDHEIVDVAPVQRRRVDIPGVVALATAVPEIQSRRRRLRRLPRRAGDHRLRLREIGDVRVRLEILEEPPVHERLVARAVRPRRPSPIAESARRPSRAQRVVRRHEILQRAIRRHVVCRHHRLRDAVRLVGILRRVGIKNGRETPVLPHQREVAAIVAQLEIGVQRRRRIRTIFRRGKDDEEAVRRETDCGENPFRNIVWIVREPPARERHGGRAVVVKFDPIRRRPVLVFQPSVIVREDFGDDDIGARGGKQDGGEKQG